MDNEKPNIAEWLSVLEKASRSQHYPALFKKVQKMLAVPSRKREAINLYKLNKHTKANDNVIVPRKILSIGKMDHKINVSALELSEGARRALTGSGCKIVNIKDMVNEKHINVII